MFLFDTERQQQYLQTDKIAARLPQIARTLDTDIDTHKWLVESSAKRMIFDAVYHDLLEPSQQKQRVLDVGGGYTALTRILVEQHDYWTLDVGAHTDTLQIRQLEEDLGKPFWICEDWQQHPADDPYQIVIANDIFPNVDQRLELFLNTYLPRCSELRLTATYFHRYHWYRTQRVDADEILHVLTWNGAQLKQVLNKYRSCIVDPDLDLLLKPRPSPFANDRQVAMITFRGERALS